MEEKREEVMRNLVEDRLRVLETQKTRLEEQITEDTAKENELQEAYLEQRREKLADTIKELKILKDEKKSENPGD